MSTNDISLFHGFNARAIFQRLPNVAFNIQRFQIPSSAIGVTEVRSKFGTIIELPGTTFNIEPLQFSWILEESMESYFEVYDWMTSSVNPEKIDSETTYGDCSIQIFSNNNNLLTTINFTDVFPISLSDVSLDATLETDEPVVVNASFAFDLMKRTKHT